MRDWLLVILIALLFLIAGTMEFEDECMDEIAKGGVQSEDCREFVGDKVLTP